ncbi:uncharacterized protein LOC128956790 [Oppia nitens]|uniref:uncharacterized protein LOC128956790 n=1 Tax=Oppia nitens TaxID=1686743 RepID=UPI0023DBC498|nr:uncharacterized protein LOC128956790 [Oppia nitens]
MVTADNDQMSISFAGCGFLGLYHVGVATCFRQYAPLTNQTLVAGASAGALAAMALVLRLPLGESTSEILSVAIKARARALGPFHPSFDVNKIIHDSLVKTLPDDCHKRVNGRLVISMTRVSDGKNVLISQFDSKEDLIKAIQCSCFIPFWSGIIPPKFHGIAYMDGGLSDNLPIIDKNTITVSPFSGESDICPLDDTYNPYQVNLVNTSISVSPSNLYRLTRILFPAHPEILSQMCQQGFDDALRYLQRNNKIACTRCLAIQSSFTLATEDDTDDDEELDEEIDSEDSGYENNTCLVADDDGGSGGGADGSNSQHHSAINCMNCNDCQYRRQIAVLDSLPDAVVQAIQEACDQVNKGVINWIFRHRPMKLLSLLSIPYLLPIDITIVLFCKVWQQVPAIKNELKTSLFNLLSFLRSLVVKMESKRHQYSAKFSCQLAVTEFDYSHEDSPQVYAHQQPVVTTTTHRKVSTMKVPNISSAKRKLSAALNPTSQTPTTPAAAAAAAAANRKVTLEKAHSFTAGVSRKRNMYATTTVNTSDASAMSTSAQELMAVKARQRLERLQKQSAYVAQRKSYAGHHDQRSHRNHQLNNEWPIDRRRSMIEMITPIVKPPERVISKMNFGFSFDLKSNNKSESDELDLESRRTSSNGVGEGTAADEVDRGNGVRGGGLTNSTPNLNHNTTGSSSSSSNSLASSESKMLDALRHIDSLDQANAIEIASKALDWERECLQKYRDFGGDSDDTDSNGNSTTNDIDKMIELTQTQEALMAFYYTDENNRVKVTEIFNIQPDSELDRTSRRSSSHKSQHINNNNNNADTISNSTGSTTTTTTTRSSKLIIDDDEDDGLIEDQCRLSPNKRLSVVSTTDGLRGVSGGDGDGYQQRQRKKSVIEYLID